MRDFDQNKVAFALEGFEIEMNVWEQYRQEKRHLKPLLTTARVRARSLQRQNHVGPFPDYHTYNVDNDHVERNGLNLHYL